MIFFRPTDEAKFNKIDMVSWKKKFAFFPKCVRQDDTTGEKMYVWLDYYEVRRYCKNFEQQTWYREYRLPGSQDFWSEAEPSYGDGL